MGWSLVSDPPGVPVERDPGVLPSKREQEWTKGVWSSQAPKVRLGAGQNTQLGFQFRLMQTILDKSSPVQTLPRAPLGSLGPT